MRGNPVVSIDSVIANKPKHVAVEAVAARFGNDIHYRSRMVAITRRQRTGLHAEFLDGIRERERHVQVGKFIDVVTAIQQIVVGILLPPATDIVAVTELVTLLLP